MERAISFNSFMHNEVYCNKPFLAFKTFLEMSLQNEQTIKACTCLKYYDERKLSISENHLALAKYTLVHIIYNGELYYTFTSHANAIRKTKYSAE